MRAALGRRDVVDIGKDVLRVIVGVLNRQAHAHVVLYAVEHQHVFIQRRFVPVDIAHVIRQPALVHEDGFLLFRVFFPFIDKRDGKPLVQIRQLAQMAADGFGIEFRFFKNGVIRQERHARAMLARRADALQRGHRAPGSNFLFRRIIIAFKAHAVVPAAGAAIHDEPFAQRVDDRRADAVQAAGIRIILMIEFAARVQPGVDHLHARDAQFRVDIDRNAAAVVLHGGAAVLVQLHGDAPGVAIGHLVNRVIHDFPKQVVQTAGACRADVHTRTHPNRIQPFKHLEHAGRIGFRHE